jgi:FtsZ-binding cell division protein ZapB
MAADAPPPSEPSLTAQLAELQQSYSALQDAHNTLLAKYHESESQLRAYMEQDEPRNALMEKQESDLTDALDKLQSRRRDIRELVAQNRRLIAENQAANKQKCALTRESAGLRAELVQFSSLCQKLRSLLPRVDELKQRNRKPEQTIESLSAALEAKDATVASLRAQISEQNDQMSVLLTDLQAKDETISTLKSQLSKQDSISEQDDQIASPLKATSAADSGSDVGDPDPGDLERQLAKANEDYEKLHKDYEATLSRDLEYHKAKADACQALGDERDASQRRVAQLEDLLFELQRQLDHEQELHSKLIQTFGDSDSLPQAGSPEASLVPTELQAALRDVHRENERLKTFLSGRTELEALLGKFRDAADSRSAPESGLSDRPLTRRAADPLERCQRIRPEDLLLPEPVGEEEEEEEPDARNSDDSPSNDQDLF